FCPTMPPRHCMERTDAGPIGNRGRVVAPDACRSLGRCAAYPRSAGVRAFGDGFDALLLPIYLVELGFSALAIWHRHQHADRLWDGWIANQHCRRCVPAVLA